MLTQIYVASLYVERDRMHKKKLVRKRRKIHKENGFGIVFYIVACSFSFVHRKKPTKKQQEQQQQRYFKVKRKRAEKRSVCWTEMITWRRWFFYVCIMYMCIEYGIYGSDYLPHIIHKHLRLPIEQQQQQQQQRQQQNHMIFKSINQCMWNINGYISSIFSFSFFL